MPGPQGLRDDNATSHQAQLDKCRDQNGDKKLGGTAISITDDGILPSNSSPALRQPQGTPLGLALKITNGHLPSPEPSPTRDEDQDDKTTVMTRHKPTGNRLENGGLGSGSWMRHQEPLENKALPSVSKSRTNGNAEGAIDRGIPVKETTRVRSLSKRSEDPDKERILKLSPEKLEELTSSPESLPRYPFGETPESIPQVLGAAIDLDHTANHSSSPDTRNPSNLPSDDLLSLLVPGNTKGGNVSSSGRPPYSSRTISTPPSFRRSSSDKPTNASQSSRAARSMPTPLQLNNSKGTNIPSKLAPPSPEPVPSPMPQSIPLPPLSIPTYLQLELSSDRPSPLYIHHSATSDFPYESSRVKFERLLNFLLLPPQLEQVLLFGTLVCLDCWLYTFTILPLRFFKAIVIVGQWVITNLVKDVKDISTIIYEGFGRMRKRRKRDVNVGISGPSPKQNSSVPPNAASTPSDTDLRDPENSISEADTERKSRRSTGLRHRRSHSSPSALLPNHKADILKGFLIICSSAILMHFDASRMYHAIRGQAAIKLYVIYNVLEVCDRLFAALGQDICECLFSKETLERKSNGRSKLLRPFGMFILALIYNVVHATALFYQVITLNVAVNSYSNALLTLLMSNQFVEIKSTVFKKFEKENLFQLTCADVVERFQLWLMLLIIALRNLIEVGGLSIDYGSGGSTVGSAPIRTNSILPRSFTILPSWTGQVMGPFLLVLGSEMLVDWLKHCYITKFNLTKPAIYGRFVDVLAKDYYSNAFTDQNLTRRLGLPVFPLSCLFIRASVQTYHMFLATHMPPPIPSTATALSEASAATSPATKAALQHIDEIFRSALGRSSFGAGPSASGLWWSLDDAIAFSTMVLVFLGLFFVLLATKLVLGMILLSLARRRYKGMKERERENYFADGKRVGGWGVVEVGDDKRRWIYQDDPEGARQLREKEKATREREKKGETNYDGVARYSMVAKRIW